MAEIKLKKRYPDIPDETVTEIFQRGYLEGWNNAREKERLDLRLAEAIIDIISEPKSMVTFYKFTDWEAVAIRIMLNQYAITRVIGQDEFKEFGGQILEMIHKEIEKKVNVVFERGEKENEAD